MNDQTQPKRKNKAKAQEIEIIPPSLPFSAKKKIGRPSEYSDEIADTILARISEGESLKGICRDLKIMNVTVYSWMRARPSFLTLYAQAREDRADSLGDDLQEIADASTPETVQVDRLRTDVRKFIAAKLNPRKWGDRVQAALTGADGGPIQVQSIQVDAGELSPDARDALRAALLTAVSGRSDDE